MAATMATAHLLEANKALVCRYLDEVFTRGVLAAADEVCGAEFVLHDPAAPAAAPPGPGGLKALAHTLRSAFPDLVVTVEEQVAEGPRVATRWSARGTHSGAFLGAPPTHREVTLAGVTFDTVVGGKVVESWVLRDRGTLPTRPPAPRPARRGPTPAEPGPTELTLPEQSAPGVWPDVPRRAPR